MQIGITRLQSSIAATVIAVQVRVDENIERAGPKDGLNQRPRLRRVRAITTINQQGFFTVGEKNIVCREPAALKNLHSRG